MAREVADDHFSTGVWAAAGALRFRHYTCTRCGTRLKTWVGFQAHRPVCSGEMHSRGGRTPGASGADLLELQDLLELVRAEEAAAPDAAGPALDPAESPDPGPPGPTLDTPRRAPVANRRGPRRGTPARRPAGDSARTR